MEKNIYHAKHDPKYEKPFIDLEEKRERRLPDGTVIPYLYVHGGFEETALKFAISYPEKESFEGRFFQYLSPFPGPDEELASQVKEGEDDIIAFSLLHGGYFLETNMESGASFGGRPDNTVVWKSSAAAAEYSRVKAAELYGCGRPYGYVFGGSGGGYKTMACIENTDAWDGAVPYVIGSPVSLPNTITLHAQGQRVLRHAFRTIVDNVDAGGSGNPCDGLNEEEAAMLREIMAMGFDPRMWYCEANGVINDGSLPVLAPTVKMTDPGYLGADPDSSANRDRLQFKTRVRKVHLPGAAPEKPEIDDRNGVDTAWQKMLADGKGAWIQLEEVPQGEDLYLSGVNVTPLTGEGAGQTFLLDKIEGDCITIGMCFGMSDLNGALSKVKPGDEIILDNSDYIAIQSYYRHQVPEDLSFHAWDQFRDENGKPALPQRKSVLGYFFTGTGTVQDGNIQGKTIVVQSLMDESTCPWCADWYRKKVAETKGGEQDFRVYYMDRCMHGDVTWMENNMVTNYLGAHRQSLLDLAAWVEKGIEPLPSSVYEYRDGQIIPAATAKERRGLQPVAKLTANGSVCTRVKAGETVSFTAHAQVPVGAGEITAMDFGFEDNRDLPGGIDADYPVKGSVTRFSEDGVSAGSSTVTYTFDKPGVYYAAVRVKANRNGDEKDLFTQVKNIARAKVIVE
ncbi:MAG: hypothetical protein VZR05_06330 [Lachnospiraceae bacterium]|nr:hypothetical protein [Lachnospiraceae bacterium]